jgi:hypothetical protein
MFTRLNSRKYSPKYMELRHQKLLWGSIVNSKKTGNQTESPFANEISFDQHKLWRIYIVNACYHLKLQPSAAKVPAPSATFLVVFEPFSETLGMTSMSTSLTPGVEALNYFVTTQTKWECFRHNHVINPLPL